MSDNHYGGNDASGVNNVNNVNNVNDVNNAESHHSNKSNVNNPSNVTKKDDTPFPSNPTNKMNDEIKDYLKPSGGGQNKLREINTDSRNNISDTDRSQFFSKYNH